MLSRVAWSLFIIVSVALYGCRKSAEPKNPSDEKTEKTERAEAVVATICMYTLGDVKASLLIAMMDSLRANYPKYKVAGNLDLLEEARTTKRHDYSGIDLIC